MQQGTFLPCRLKTHNEWNQSALGWFRDSEGQSGQNTFSPIANTRRAKHRKCRTDGNQLKTGEVDAPGMRGEGNPTRLDNGWVDGNSEKYGSQRVILLDPSCAAGSFGSCASGAGKEQAIVSITAVDPRG